MSGVPTDHDERPRLDASTLPDELQRRWDTMLRLDPDWDMNDWLIERANEEMKIIESKGHSKVYNPTTHHNYWIMNNTIGST